MTIDILDMGQDMQTARTQHSFFLIFPLLAWQDKHFSCKFGWNLQISASGMNLEADAPEWICVTHKSVKFCEISDEMSKRLTDPSILYYSTWLYTIEIYKNYKNLF